MGITMHFQGNRRTLDEDGTLIGYVTGPDDIGGDVEIGNWVETVAATFDEETGDELTPAEYGWDITTRPLTDDERAEWLEEEAEAERRQAKKDLRSAIVEIRDLRTSLGNGPGDDGSGDLAATQGHIAEMDWSKPGTAEGDPGHNPDKHNKWKPLDESAFDSALAVEERLNALEKRLRDNDRLTNDLRLGQRRLWLMMRSLIRALRSLAKAMIDKLRADRNDL